MHLMDLENLVGALQFLRQWKTRNDHAFGRCSPAGRRVEELTAFGKKRRKVWNTFSIHVSPRDEP